MKIKIASVAGALALATIAAAGVAAGGHSVAGSGSPAQVAASAPDTVLDSYELAAPASAPLRIADGAATITAGGAPQGFAAAPRCQTSAMVAGGRYLKVASVDWARGRLVVKNLLPVCAGVVIRGGGGQYAFEVGAKPQGRAKRPNLPLFPQSRVATTPWHNLNRGAGQATTIAFPPVRNQCTQTDVGILTQGTPSAWPTRLTKLGQTQPRGIGFYVGNGKGCLSAPAVSVVSKCPTDCTGTSTLSYTVRNRNPYALVQVRLIAAGRVGGWVQVGPGSTKTVSVKLGDGAHYRFQTRSHLGSWTPVTNLGGTREIVCPPAPHLSFTLGCPCGGAVRGTVTDTNGTRYAHRVSVAGASGPSAVTVAAHKAGGLSGLSWARGRTVTVTVQSYLGSRAVGAPTRVPLTVG